MFKMFGPCKKTELKSAKSTRKELHESFMDEVQRVNGHVNSQVKKAKAIARKAELKDLS